MRAWKPPERVPILRLEGRYAGVRYGDGALPEEITAEEVFRRIRGIPESVALEREKVLREVVEALERYVRLDEAGCVDDGDSGALDQARAALDSQGDPTQCK